MTSQLVYWDNVALDNADAKAGTNSGLLIRRQYTKESKEFDMESGILEDLFRLDKYLLNGVDLHIKFYRNSAPFLIMSGETTPDYKLQILDCVYKVAMVKVDGGIILNHAEILKTTTAKYPMVRSEVKTNTVPIGSGSFVWQNIWNNSLPDKVFVGLVNQDALNGSYTKNPFNFLNVASEVALYVNGELINTRPMCIDNSKSLHITPFVELFEGADKWNKDSGLIINRKSFANGYTIFAFNITPSDLGEQYINLVRQGSVRLEIKFAANTSSTLSVVAYGEFSSMLEVDESRDVRIIQ